MTKKVAILGYHKIGHPPGEWYTWNYVSAENFKEQLEFIHRNNWAVLSAEKFVRGLSQPDLLPERSILITFDDGYINNRVEALPHLQTHKFASVIFVPVHYVGGYNAFDADIFYEPKEDICSWSILKELDSKGMSVQSHGMNHVHFSELDRQQLLHEIGESKKLIEENMGNHVKLFAFPYGDGGENCRVTNSILKEAGYCGAFLYEGGVMEIGKNNPFQIPRIPVGADTDVEKELQKALFF
jgi:peptidoglycan/xylan/chitin deacetylase (PgdA/CDA1 family)